MIAWKRKLKITLYSGVRKKKKIFENIIGQEYNMSVTINKHLSALKDSCTIEISNLPYSEVVEIIDGQYYNVSIEAGYETCGATQVFKGGVVYVSNKINDTKTNTVIILCASLLVAQYKQKRLNLTLQSSINMYAALDYIFQSAGIKDAKISESFKNKYLQKTSNTNDYVCNYLEQFTNTEDNIIVSADASNEATVSVFDLIQSKDMRIVTLKKDNIIFDNSYPRLSADGLSVNVFPTFPFVCGDIIKIDNSLIDMGTSNDTTLLGFKLDTEGKYLIWEMTYILQNRGSEFSIGILAKSRNLLRNYLGDNV